MFGKSKVKIKIESRFDEQEIVQEFSGECFPKEHAMYLRYSDSNENQKENKTTIRLHADEMKLIRHGEIQSEQTFVPNKKTSGYMHTVGINLKLQMYTHFWTQTINEGIWIIKWSYDLWIDEQQAGHYDVKLIIKEDLVS